MNPPSEILRYGACVCLRIPDESRRAVAGAAIPALASRRGFRNEFSSEDGHPPDAIAFLRRIEAAPERRVLDGVVRPTNFTGHRMQEFAYARQVMQRPGHLMHHAFLHPMSKTPEWWAKDCAALRDVSRNPEWRFVASRPGPAAPVRNGRRDAR